MTTNGVAGTAKHAKLCLWCEKEIKRPTKRLSNKEWATIRFHKECVTAYRHHQCPQSQVEAPPPRECPACHTLLVRREKESWQAWIKRKTCSRSCAAKGTVRVRPPVEEVAVAEQRRVGCIQYRPGTPEFRQVAALYGG